MNCKDFAAIYFSNISSHNRIRLNGSNCDAAICIPRRNHWKYIQSDSASDQSGEGFLDKLTGGRNNGPKISIDNNPLSIDPTHAGRSV